MIAARLLPPLLALLLATGCDFQGELSDCIAARTCIDQELTTRFQGGGNGQPLGSFLLAPEQRLARTVRWNPVPVAAEYQFQAAPCPTGPLAECAFDQELFEQLVSATEVSVPFPLQGDGAPYVGRYVYRVRPCRTTGSEACGRWSAPRYFRAGHPAGPSPGDLDGDHLAEVVVGDPGANVAAGEVRIYGWDGSAFTEKSVKASPLPATLGFGRAVAHLGDVNADGFGDLLVAGAMGTTAYLVLGGTTLANPVALTARGAGFPASVAPAGDFNGDGYADALISDHPSQTDTSVLVYLGGPTGLESTPSIVLEPPTFGGAVGPSMVAVDLDLDGLDDVVAGSLPGTGAAYVYYGSASPGNRAPEWVPSPSPPDVNFGREVIAMGDLDADGAPEVMILGTDDRVDLLIPDGREPPGREVHAPGTNVLTAVAGNLDGDAFTDAVYFGNGSYQVFRGSVDGLADPPTVGVDSSLQPVAAVVGDVDGDGIDEVAVRALEDGAPAVQVLFPPDQQKQRISRPVGASADFGAALAPIR